MNNSIANLTINKKSFLTTLRLETRVIHRPLMPHLVLVNILHAGTIKYLLSG